MKSICIKLGRYKNKVRVNISHQIQVSLCNLPLEDECSGTDSDKLSYYWHLSFRFRRSFAWVDLLCPIVLMNETSTKGNLESSCWMAMVDSFSMNACWSRTYDDDDFFSYERSGVEVFTHRLTKQRAVAVSSNTVEILLLALVATVASVVGVGLSFVNHRPTALGLGRLLPNRPPNLPISQNICPFGRSTTKRSAGSLQ